MVNETDGAAANVQKHLKEELRKSIESFSLRTIAGVRVADLRVPQLFWSLLPRIDRYAYAATLRDDLYWDQDGTRRQTGDILLAAMKETDVTSVTRAVIYGGIRTGSPPVWLILFMIDPEIGVPFFLDITIGPISRLPNVSRQKPDRVAVFSPPVIDRKPHDG